MERDVQNGKKNSAETVRLPLPSLVSGDVVAKHHTAQGRTNIKGKYSDSHKQGLIVLIYSMSILYLLQMCHIYWRDGCSEDMGSLFCFHLIMQIYPVILFCASFNNAKTYIIILINMILCASITILALLFPLIHLIGIHIKWKCATCRTWIVICK